MADNPNFVGEDSMVVAKRFDSKPDGDQTATTYYNMAYDGKLDEATEGNRRQYAEGAAEEDWTKKEIESGRELSGLLYTVDEAPVWYMTILFGFQHYVLMATSTITVPYVLFGILCIDDSDPARGRLVCTMLFTSGIITLLQTTFGVRLPIIQGGTFSFLVPTIAYITTTFPKCEEMPLANMTALEREEDWMVRMRAIQGAVIVSCIFQMVIGFTGLVGILLKIISPLTIVPTIVLIGLVLFETATDMAAKHWGMSWLTMILITLFSQFLDNVPIPLPSYTREKGFRVIWFDIFKLFSLVLAILVAWFMCWILTVSDALPENNPARTDGSSVDLISLSPWIIFPYPFQFGIPTFSVAGVLGMTAGMIASMVESIGDYYACARMGGAQPPPPHAMNRGIGMEGLGGILCGIWGTGNASTSYSTNIGAIGITKVGSRRVVQAAGILMIVFGMFGKFGAVFVSIPDPVIGGVFCVMFGMISAVGLSSLQFVNLNSSRNLYILGFSIFMGLALPKWMLKNPGVIKTGVDVLDQIITVLLQTSMLIGGAIGCFLDNLVPGTPEERGILKWNQQGSEGPESEDVKTYDIPFVMNAIRRASWTKYIPFSPTFQGFRTKSQREFKVEGNA